MSDEIREALEKIFSADSTVYQQRGFQQKGEVRGGHANQISERRGQGQKKVMCSGWDLPEG